VSLGAWRRDGIKLRKLSPILTIFLFYSKCLLALIAAAIGQVPGTSDVKQVFLVEEFPFCLKAVLDDNLSSDSSQIKGLLDKFYGHAKLTGFLAGRKIPG